MTSGPATRACPPTTWRTNRPWWAMSLRLSCAVERHPALRFLEPSERVHEGVRDHAAVDGPLGPDGEHRVSLQLLDLEGRRQAMHHGLEQRTGNLGAML